MKICIVGAGLSGITASILLQEKGHRVEIFETRNHIGGNCYDSWINNILVHNYGGHIFHTNNKKVWDFLNRYTVFNDYKHKVVANTKKGYISIPLNHKIMKDFGVKKNEIIDLIYKDYSEKMWGCSFDKIDSDIIKRVPKIRNCDNNYYFQDKYQGIPINGYTVMFNNMLGNVVVHLNCDKNEWRRFEDCFDLIIYTGSIDEYYDYKFGELYYRSLVFDYKQLKKRKNCVINQCNKNSHVREMDHSHWLNQNVKDTIISFEYPYECIRNYTIPMYPYPDIKNLVLYRKYIKIPNKKTMFLGRLGTYQYLDMDKTILQVMKNLKNF